MNMTVQQENCVNHRGSSLLVSAGAGSGKTSTLAQRIITRISDPSDKAEIDDFLIVTFTNASAQDLSEKIERAVSKCVAADITNRKAVRQLAKIKYANISTISSFCLSVVKKHFQHLGLPAKIRICDEAERDLLKRQAILYVIEEKYDSCGDGALFFDAVEMFSGDKNDDRFVDLIFKLHGKIFSDPNPQGWCRKALEKYEEIISCDDFFDTKNYGAVAKNALLESVNEYISALESACLRMKDIPELEGYVSKFCTDIENAIAFCEKLRGGMKYDDVCDRIFDVTKSSLVGVRAKYDADFKTSITDLRNKAYAKLQKTVRVFANAKTCVLKDASRDALDILNELFDIIFRVENRFSAEKKERGIIDFSDAEKYTYRLFVDSVDEKTGKVTPTEIARHYRDTFEEIYIDEYQDINKVQDVIFRSICKYDENGHELNRFMVGDIKQSIYRFRGACPDLFASYLSSFSQISENKERCERKEFLSNNFRCSRGVVEFTNLIFSKIMPEAYGEEDKLVFSRNENVLVDSPSELVFFEENDDEEDYYGDEVKAAAQKIIEICNNDNILSSDGKPFTYGDVAILLPAVTNISDKYARYLENCGIPAYSDVSDNFFENAEIMLCLCLLNSIDNPLRDVYVTGAMRSEIFGFYDDDLLTLRRLGGDVTGSDRPMWRSVCEMAESDFEDDSLVKKCKKFAGFVHEFKKMSVGMPSDKLLLKMYSKLHLINIVSESSFNRYTENASSRRENLMILYNQARNFEKTSFRGLSAFLEFLKERAERPDSIRSASSSESRNAVRIMSIHRSKGLEFPVCLLCGFSSQFNKSDERENLCFSDEMGIGFKFRDLSSVRSGNSASSIVKFDTPFRNAVKVYESKLLLEEKKRLLYVAMTRAKDRLLVLLKKPDADELESFYSRSKRNTGIAASHFRDWFLYSVACYDSMAPLYVEYGIEHEHMISDEKASFCASTIKPESIYRSLAISSDNDFDFNSIFTCQQKIKDCVDFKYPYSPLTVIRSKVSVSDIKHGRLCFEAKPPIPTEKDLARPAFLDDMSKDAASVGTAMHEFMQYADYSECERSIENEAKKLVENGYISGEQYALLDYAKLSVFFESDIYKSLKSAKRVYRESSFTLSLSLCELYEGISADFSSETALVQGKIDCFFEDSDGTYTVVDFKTDRVSNMHELVDRYKLQLEYYKRAVTEMTGVLNVKMAIYSFFLGKTIYV
ncbi:MAG: helicase-exonuclease AddAB subunit AddA [Ruminococcaceae bacterium]|nr:helicase-exonuclease AddAB subunit AddA [Oscillospiraceae bacterium]